jgi:hypothetical protein
MKTCLVDFTNRGVIYVFDNPNNKWHVSLLRSCIIDTGIYKIFPNHSLYKEINNNSIREKFYQGSKTESICLGNTHEINDYFLEKQRLALLMMPPIQELINALFRRSFDILLEHGLPMDDTLAFEILNSNPDTNTFSSGIIEYANTLDVTPLEAYQELRIEYESIHSIKIKTYAVSKKYQRLIRAIKTEEDSKRITADIVEKLITDTFI